MMKTFSRYFALLLILLLSFTVNAQDGDAVYNKIMKVYTLHEDGSYDYREYKEVKLLSHMSFHRLFGETFVIFDPEYQEVVINEAYTIMKDGTKVAVPDNAFNEVLPRAARHSAPYNKLRELVITHTGLEVGATIYLDYTIKTKAGFMQTFMGEEVIRENVPVKEKKVIVRIPENKELHYKVLNLRTGAEITEEKGMKVYSFTFREIRENMNVWGVDHSLDPVLFFSAAKDLERAYFPFVAQKAFTYPSTEAMTKKAIAIKDDSRNDMDAVLNIQKMVVNELGTWNVQLEYTGFTCRTPVETWKSNAGTLLEKSILLATLLQKAGFRAAPVAVIPQKYYDRKVGSLYIIEDFAVQVGVADAPIFISATSTSSQDLGISLQGKLFLILDGAIESLKTYESESLKNAIVYNGDVSISDENKLSETLVVTLKGNANPYFKLISDTAYAKRYSSHVKEAVITALDKKEGVFKLSIDKENACEKYGDYAFLNIPSSNFGISSWGFSYIEKDRNVPIKLPETIHEKYNFTIEIPEGYELISPAVTVDVNNGIGKVTISIKQEKNTVKVTREIILNKDLIRYNEFDAFNDLWKPWMNASFKKLTFKVPE